MGCNSSKSTGANENATAPAANNAAEQQPATGGDNTETDPGVAKSETPEDGGQ